MRFLSIEDAARKIDIDEETLTGWEKNVSSVSLTQFEKVAKAYKIPSSVLFSKSAPTAPALPEDFRTFLGKPPSHSFDFSVAFSRAADKARRLFGVFELTDTSPPALPLYKVDISPEELAASERSRLDLNPLGVLDWDSGKVFHKYRAIIEDAGVPVFQENFPTNDCRGFTFHFEGLGSVIVINRNEEFKKAKAFTLLHEYCHVLRREHSLSDLDSKNPKEAYCNRFAAAFLMPPELIRKVFGEIPNSPRNDLDAYIRHRASRMKVSQQALAIRLEELGYAPKGFAKKYSFYSGFTPRKKSKGGNSTATLLSDSGGLFATKVAEAVANGRLGTYQLSDVFGERFGDMSAVLAAVDRQEKYARER